MPSLKMSPEKAVLLINGRIDEITTLAGKQDLPEYYDIVSWCSKTYAVIDKIYEAGDIPPEEIRSIVLPTCSCNSRNAARLLLEVYHSRLVGYVDEIQQSVTKPDQD